MKLFNTNSMEKVKACQEYFWFELPIAFSQEYLEKRKKTIETKFMSIRIMHCQTLCDVDYLVKVS